MEIVKPVEKSYLNDDNISYIESVGTAGLIKDLTKKGNKSAVYKEVMGLIEGIKKKYNFNKGVLNSILQKTWMDNNQFTESVITAYADELKKFDVSTVTDALHIFYAMDDLIEKERIAKEEAEKQKILEAEEAEKKKLLEEEQAKKRAEEQAQQEIIEKKLQVAERQRAIELEIKKKEELKEYFTTTEPELMLKDIRSGRKPYPSEINLIKELKEVYKFPNYVINPLIQFVLLYNDNKLHEQITKKFAGILKETDFQTVDDSMSYFQANVEYLKEVRLEVLASLDKVNELNYYDKQYISQTKAMYFLDEDIVIEIIKYSKNLNHNFLIKWFTDKVVEFVVASAPTNVEEVQALLKEFHLKYIIPMGK